MKVSNSKIGWFKRCKRGFFYEYKMLLTPIVKAWPLIDGEAYHQATETYHQPITKPGGAIPVTCLLNDCLRWMGIRLDEISKNRLMALASVDRFYDAIQNDENEDEVQFHRHLVMGMIAGYTILYGHDEWTMVKTEIKETIQVEDFELTFKADALVAKEGSSKFWIIEYKTTSSDSKERFMDRMLMDWQPTLYIYGFQKKGYDVVGVLYDVVKKPKIYQNKLESNEAFNNRMVKTLIADALKGGEKYYFREPVYRTPADLEEFESDLKNVVADIAYHQEKDVWYKEPARCWDFNTACDKSVLCKEADAELRDSLIKTSFRRKG